MVAMAPPSNIFTDMAPPSYASVLNGQQVNIGDENDQHTKGNLNYMPVYTFAQPYQVNKRLLFPIHEHTTFYTNLVSLNVSTTGKVNIGNGVSQNSV